MRSAILLLSTVMLLAICGSSASGQYYGMPGFYGGYASTPGEGAAMGMSAMVRAAGMASLTTSMAASNFEDARSKNIDNHIKYAKAYDERQRLVKAQRAEMQAEREAKRKPLTSEQMYRWAQQGVPKPLSASQLDPVTGAIHWPVALRDDPFKSYRESTEMFFHEAIANPQSFSYDSYHQIQEAGTDCLAQLKSHIKDYRPDDYIQAKKFVESLTYAAQHM